MRILILGVTGMLGNAVFRVLRQDPELEVWGTARAVRRHTMFDDALEHIVDGLDVLDNDALQAAFAKVRPDVVINCIGLIKQLDNAEDPLAVLPVNAMLPHRLARLSELARARLIHVSTDCVFSGDKGSYLESDESDARDLYGKSKYIGEVRNASHAITLRTSIIGHELGSRHALLEWFLAQHGKVRGFARAVFSGLPTVELARVIHEFVLPRSELHGLYHVAAQPIAKLDLLRLIARTYQKEIEIVPDEALVIDRSLNGSRFELATGYRCPAWPELIATMHEMR